MRQLTTVIGLCLLASCATNDRFDNTRATKAWASNDDPSLFSDDFEYRFDQLPTSGESTQAPWAGNYWPTYRDNLNYKWEGPGTLSPAAKMGQAFGYTDLEDEVSRVYGIDSQSHRTTCTTNDDCKKDSTETCAKRDGEDSGTCIETWFGICHSWAPAAIMEPEPKHAVTFNNTTFKVNDIKALVSLAYDKGLEVEFLSGRCNDNNKTGEIEFDAAGRPLNADCEDTNAGTFHVVATNMLGIQGVSFIEDRTFDYEVWNQPVRSYDVTHNVSVTAAEAMALIGGEGEAYAYNDAAVSFRHIKMTFRYITESGQELDGNLDHRIDDFTKIDRYEYILELDADGKIIGGEWVGDSKTAHPDFLWLPTVKRDTTTAGIPWYQVKNLLNLSVMVEENWSEGGFNWGSACSAGTGTFNQDIPYRDRVEIGTIPVDKANVRIDLKAGATDVDIQLVAADGTKIVDWEADFLNGPDQACKTYQGVEYCYSGYNGVDGRLGDEYVEIRGVTNQPLTMYAYGYQAGNATVDYSWAAKPDCVDAGSGSFNQDIAQNDVVQIGVIPADKVNVRIELDANEDVDIQLFADRYDGSTPIVKWAPNAKDAGLLNGANERRITYQDMVITYSGYNGVDGKLGKEFITIEGRITTPLTMKAFGYAAGTAEVRYAWGVDADALGSSL